MTIKQRLYISFSLILFILMFIIGVFFYTLFNLNEVHNSQKHRYDQIRRVEKLKEYNNSFSWIALDIITDYEKMNIVKLLSRELFLLYMCLKINNIKSLIKFYPLNILYIKTDSLPLFNQTNVF